MFRFRLAAPASAVALALFSLLGLAGVGASPAVAATAPAAPTVKIDNFTFGPTTLTVTVGTTVTWVNQDDIPHTVVADDKSFKSKVLDTDQRFSFTFTKPGEFGYFCSLHPHMTGKVVVKPS
jgi:plastocyanin